MEGWAELFLHTTGSTADEESPGHSLIGTEYALRLIHKHQHPGNCSHAKFFLWLPADVGIGKLVALAPQRPTHVY